MSKITNIYDFNSITSVNVPSNIFKNRSMSILETLVVFMKDEYQLTYHQIAQMLNRDDRTVWTAYKRGKKKEE